MIVSAEILEKGSWKGKATTTISPQYTLPEWWNQENDDKNRLCPEWIFGQRTFESRNFHGETTNFWKPTDENICGNSSMVIFFDSSSTKMKSYKNFHRQPVTSCHQKSLKFKMMTYAHLFDPLASKNYRKISTNFIRGFYSVRFVIKD